MYIETIFFAVALVCVVFFFSRYRRLRARHAQLIARQQTDRATQKLRDQRINLGGRIYNAIVAAARENVTGWASVDRYTNNAGCYSIVVRYDEPGVARHLQACFSVNIKYDGENDRELRVLEGNYGPVHYYAATEAGVEKLLPWLKEKTRGWGVNGEFPKRQ